MKNVKKRINQFGLITAALGFVFGHTFSEFINSIVADAVMPIFSLIFNIEDWKNHSIFIYSYSFIWGDIVKNGIRFLVVTLGILYILRWLEDTE
jgi:large-conductance mechanosensitive channel